MTSLPRTRARGQDPKGKTKKQPPGDSVGDLFWGFQEINISHLGKGKIIFKYALSGGYVNSLEGKSSDLLEKVN